MIVIRDTDTDIFFNSQSVSVGDYIAWLPAWYADAQQGNPCRSAYAFAENAGHDSNDDTESHKYGGFVQEGPGGVLFVTVNLPMGAH